MNKEKFNSMINILTENANYNTFMDLQINEELSARQKMELYGPLKKTITELHNSNNYEKSLNLCNFYIEKINLDISDIYIDRSNVLIYISKFDDALEDCNKAIELNPNNINGYFNLAGTYSNMKNYDKSIEIYSSLLDDQKFKEKKILSIDGLLIETFKANKLELLNSSLIKILELKSQSSLILHLFSRICLINFMDISPYENLISSFNTNIIKENISNEQSYQAIQILIQFIENNINQLSDSINILLDLYYYSVVIYKKLSNPSYVNFITNTLSKINKIEKYIKNTKNIDRKNNILGKIDEYEIFLYREIFIENISIESYEKYCLRNERNLYISKDPDYKYDFEEKILIELIEEYKSRAISYEYDHDYKGALEKINFAIDIYKNGFDMDVDIYCDDNHGKYNNLYNSIDKFDLFFTFNDLIDQEEQHETKIKNQEILIKHEEQHKIELQQAKLDERNNIFQAVSHTLSNILVSQNVVIKNLSSDHLLSDAKKLKLYHKIMASLMDSIQLAFTNDKKIGQSKIKFYNENASNTISLFHIFYFCLNMNLQYLLEGVGKWEGINELFFEITDSNEDEIDEYIESISKDDNLSILDFIETDIDKFVGTFNGDMFNRISKYFDIKISNLKDIYVKQDEYTFSIFFIIFTELTKNMLKYGTIRDKGSMSFSIKSSVNEDKSTSIIFSNLTSNYAKNEGNTLQGLQMVKAFSEVLGSFDKNSTNISDEYNKFDITIKLENIKGA